MLSRIFDEDSSTPARFYSFFFQPYCFSLQHRSTFDYKHTFTAVANISTRDIVFTYTTTIYSTPFFLIVIIFGRLLFLDLSVLALLQCFYYCMLFGIMLIYVENSNNINIIGWSAFIPFVGKDRCLPA